MNIRNGFLRIWIVLSVIWSLIIGIQTYVAITSSFAFPTEYYYIPQLKSKKEKADWTKPFDELNIRPGAGSEKEIFSELDWDEKKKWEENGRMSASTAIQFEDGTLLYVPSEIVKTSGRKIGEIFLSQRWERYLDKLWLYIAAWIIPPVILLFLGFSIFWIIRGFKSSKT